MFGETFSRIPRGWKIALGLIVTIGLAVPFGWYVYEERSAAIIRLRANDMDAVFMGLVNYESDKGQLPAATQLDGHGHPLCSWRFSIARWLESAGGDIDSEIPWDDPRNKKWREIAPTCYCLSPKAKSTRCTNIAAVTGAGTAFDSATARRINDLPPATIVLIDVADSGIHWMEPGGDVSVEDVPSTITGGIDGNGVHVEFADGLDWFLRSDVPVDNLRKFFTIDAARENDRNMVLQPYLIAEYEGYLHRSK
jgi:hypothetical protein